VTSIVALPAADPATYCRLARSALTWLTDVALLIDSVLLPDPVAPFIYNVPALVVMSRLASEPVLEIATEPTPSVPLLSLMPR
jgi:hypothetical protein